MDNLDIFQTIFGKVDEFGWWYMEIIQTDAGTQFKYKEFHEGLSIHGVLLELVELYHQEMNVQVEVTLLTFRTITHSIIVHAQVSDKYIHFALMYKTGYIFPVILIKQLVNLDSEPTTPHKLATGMKPSVSNLLALLFPCVVRKATSHFDTKA